MPTFAEVVVAFDAREFVPARTLCAQLARGGDARAMQLLGRWHSTGEAGCARDPGLAAYWFFQAWQSGLDEAESDIIRIRADLEAAADSGSAEAQNALGLLLCFGHDEPAAAADWFEQAAAQNHPEALRTLGYLYEGGKGLPPDDARAVQFYRLAAEHGDPFAQFNLAVMLDQGRGVPQRDVEGATRWLRSAAEQGMVEAAEALEAMGGTVLPEAMGGTVLPAGAATPAPAGSTVPPGFPAPRLVVLISGGGTTLQNLIDRIADGRIAAQIVGVVSSRADAFGIDRAKKAGLPAIVVERGEPNRVWDAVRSLNPDLVCLAGWLKLLPIPEDFHRRVLNIHPSLLPAFGGKGMFGHRVHEAVLAAGLKESGCTVHFADDTYDTGPILVQNRVPVLEGDTPDSLAARVFVAECEAYPEAIRMVAKQRGA